MKYRDKKYCFYLYLKIVLHLKYLDDDISYLKTIHILKRVLLLLRYFMPTIIGQTEC